MPRSLLGPQSEGYEKERSSEEFAESLQKTSMPWWEGRGETGWEGAPARQQTSWEASDRGSFLISPSNSVTWVWSQTQPWDSGRLSHSHEVMLNTTEVPGQGCLAAVCMP